SRPPDIAKPAKRRSPLWAKLSIALGILLILVGSGSFALFQATVTEINHAIPKANLLGSAAATQFTGNAISGPLNILIVGVDASGTRRDPIITPHVPASHDRVYLVSIPRDLKVDVPQGGTNKINSTFDTGFANLALTIKQNFGITFNGGLIVNFNGFQDII